MFMRRKDAHPSREELLRTSDGELSRRQADLVQRHLHACWECRAQMREIEGSIEEYVRVHRNLLDPLLPPAAGPRALLKAQLREFATDQSVPWGRVAAALAALCLLAAVGFVIGHRAAGSTVAIPNSTLTPGVSVSLSKDAICAVSPPKNKVVPIEVRQAVFGAYGIRNADPGKYEVDYLITPSLGGADDIRNLWPQSYSTTTWNARVKDALEDRLHELVCSGELDLATAQRDISRNWIAAYKYYFHTDRPISQ